MFNILSLFLQRGSFSGEKTQLLIKRAVFISYLFIYSVRISKYKLISFYRM